MHFGKITFGVDERGEVGTYYRAISSSRLRLDADQTLFGGHIMAMNGSKMFVDGVVSSIAWVRTCIWRGIRSTGI